MKYILKALGLALGLSVTGLAAPTSGPAGTFIVNTSSVANRQEFSVYKATVTNLVAFPFLTAGQCLTTNAAGQVTGVACGSGSANVAVTTGTAAGFSSIASSPTAVINFDSNTFTATLEGASTVYVGLLNPFLTTSSAAITYLQLSSATATYLQNSSATVTYLQSSSAAITYIQVSTTLAVAHGGTGTSSPGLIAGSNITSITGTWPNQTINAAGGGVPNGLGGQFQYYSGGSFAGSPDLSTSTIGIAITTFTASSATVSGPLAVKTFQMLPPSNVKIYGDSSLNDGFGASVYLNNSPAGVNNLGVGDHALAGLLNGSNNTIMGGSAGTLISLGNFNTCGGTFCLNGTVTTNDQTGFGYFSLNQSTGNANTALGSLSGTGLLTSTASIGGSYLTFLGYNTSVSTTTPFFYSTAVGAGSVISASNTIQMGGTGIYAASVNMSTFTASSATIKGPLTISNSNLILLRSGDNTSTVTFHNVSANGRSLDIDATDGLTINGPSSPGGIAPTYAIVDLAVAGAATSGTGYGSFAVIGSSTNGGAAYSGFTSTNNISQSTLWSLPKTDGTSGQFLKTDGQTHLSFASAGSGSGGGYNMEPSTVPLQFAKGVYLGTNTVNGAYTITSTDTVVFASGTITGTGVVQYSLPSAASACKNGTGQTIQITKVDTSTGVVNIVPNGTDLIFGSTRTLALNALGQTDSLISDCNSNWWPGIGGIQITPYITSGQPAVSAYSVGTSSNVFFCPVTITVPVSTLGMSFTLNSTAAGAVIDMGLYDFYGTRLAHVGTTSISGFSLTNHNLSFPGPVNIPPGIYYLALQSAGPSLAQFFATEPSSGQNHSGCKINMQSTDMSSSYTMSTLANGDHVFELQLMLAGGSGS